MPTAAEQQALSEAAGQSPKHASFYGTPNGTFAGFTASNAYGLDQIPSYVQLLDQRFPASGFRNHSDGHWSSAGTYSYFWSGSSSSSTEGFSLFVQPYGAVQNKSFLQHGFVVRCVRN
ncbi:hypothetical protein [Bacteroides sp. 51]|uniref:hypothetical protein n=1 Tax=Bacteroides sp. 51 TaxID=2302938 RepID=UPI00351AC8C5